MAYELARYWGEYMNNHGTSATLAAIPSNQIDAVYQDCENALDSDEDFGWLHSWIATVQYDIWGGIYNPRWAQEYHEQQEYEKEVAQKAPRKEYVYLLWTSIGIYKIGYTENPQRRIAEFKAMPFQCRWECLIESEDGRELERQLHGRFKDKVIPPKREWFNLSGDDVEYIKSLAVGV